MASLTIETGNRMISSTRLRAVAGALLLLVGACTPPLINQSTVEYSEEAANVFVSAYPPVPWSEIADKLEPKRNITIEQAKLLAAQTTQIQVSQFVSQFSAALGIGLPTRTGSTTVTLKPDGSQETTGTKTQGTGTVPSSSGVTAPTISDSTLTPNLTQGPLAVPLDGAGQLMAETGIFQLGHVLDNQISKAFYPKGYQAHLLTLQVNLQPKARNLPYDVYVDIVLTPATWDLALKSAPPVDKAAGELPAVIVYPLVITDAMETASIGRSVEAIRQAALSLSGVVAGAGVNAGVAGGTNKLDSIIGADRNSIVTVGRVSDHTLRMRLGAINQGSSGQAIVPRTHNVSVVVFTKWDGTAEIDRLLITTHTDIVPVAGGERLKTGRLRAELAEKVDRTVQSYGFGVSPDCDLTKKADPINAKLDLLRALDNGDYQAVSKCLGLGSQVSAGTEVRLRRLLPALMSLEADSRYSKMVVQLRPVQKPKLPNKEQLVLLTDDGESATSIVVRGGSALDVNLLTAALKLNGTARDVIVLYPTTLAVARSGAEIQLSFPSLKALGFQPTDLVNEPLELRYAGSGSSSGLELYRVRALSDGAKPAANPVSTTSTVLVANDTGTAKVMLRIGKVDPSNLPLIVITGAEVREVAPAGVVVLNPKGLQVQSAGVVSVGLGNLTPAQAVVMKTLDAKNTEIGSPIRLTVERIVGASR